MAVDHLGRMDIDKLLRQVREIATQTIQNSAIGRAGIRVYDGGWIRIEDGGLQVTGTAVVSGDLNVTGTETVAGTLTITGTLTGSGDIAWTGHTSLQGPVDVIGNMATWGTLLVLGATTLNGSVTLNNDLTVGSGRIVAGSITIDKNGGYGGRIAAPTLLFDSGTSRFTGTLIAGNISSLAGISAISDITTLGEVRAVGNIIGANKYFRIDHPSKPGKHLMHGSLEGSEHGVYYRGIVEFDADGEAVFELPDYFTALVLEDDVPTVQVTASGRPFLTGAERVKDGRVTVYGDPGRQAHVTVIAARGRFEVEPDQPEPADQESPPRSTD